MITPKLSVVVPCFNEEANLDELYNRMTAICSAAMEGDYELLLVDDGSSDATWEGIELLACGDPHIHGISLSRNYGHQLALSAGLQCCRGDLILIIDADLQDPPELLPIMLEKIDQGYDVAYGKRRSRSGETFFKKATATAFYKIINRLVSIDIPVNTGDFRLITRRVLNALQAMPEQHRFIRGMIAWIGYRQIAIEYDRQPRFAGSTKYPLRKMINFAFDAITSFSIVPLRLASLLGFAVGCVSLVGIGYSLLGWLCGEALQGWTSTILAVLLLGSVQLITLGIFGEYLGRLYMESKRRPLFLISKRTS
ncbi:glycosyltransferase family 2 protein [Solidesulfovibrio sp. C21]|uniref:glycosyltransferase family 2 protein n=1 Tax=Solidesulfovibrio sp. C21 TaxID=3398613 RepID=UPI0039FDD22F